MEIADIESVRSALLAQAELFEDPVAYAAGVEDALEALADLTVTAPERVPLTTAGGWLG